MQKLLLSITLTFILPMMMNGQTFSSLWKQVKEASDSDLPQTEQKLLRQIAKKAEKEKAYGQLLKAEVQEARSLSEVSPDSLSPAVERLKTRAQLAGDEVLRAVYNTVLGYVYENNRQLDEHHEQLAKEYYQKALSEPAKLAAVKASVYNPFVVEGSDSRFFGDDLLSVIGYEARRFDVLREYYKSAGMPRALLFSSLEWLKQQRPRGVVKLNKADYLERIDSLLAEFGDLTEAGEIAIERYEYMDSYTDASEQQKWQYINEALDRWGSWQRMNVLRNAQRDMSSLKFNVKMEHQVNIPQKPQTVELQNMRGITQLVMHVYSVNANGDITESPSSSYGYKKIKPLLTPLPHLTQTRTFVAKQPYEQFDDSLTLEGLPVGVYMLEFESQGGQMVDRSFYFVSDLRVLTQALPDKKIRYVVVNATTGQPIKGAKVELFNNSYQKTLIDTQTTNKQGECVYTYKNNAPGCAFATTATDKCCPPINSQGYFSFYDGSTSTRFSIDIFTDRQIYRPGQAVHAAVIYYKTEKGYESQALAGRDITVQLRDANDKNIGEKKLVTDEFGTCSVQFTLPTQGLTGNFAIVAGTSRQSIRVEEYKRPAFEVEIPPVKQNYEDGDTLLVKGFARSYAGVPVQDARVSYKVVRRRAFWWMSYSSYWNQGWIGTGSDDEELFSSETVTSQDGSFEVEMPMVLPKTLYPMFYNFVVTAKVTDQAGETHEGTLSMPLGNRKTAFSVTIPQKVLAEEETKMAFHQQNAAGIDLDAQVRYRFDDSGKWQEVSTNKLFTVPKMKSGAHTLQAICDNDTLEQTFTVFSLDDKRPAVETDDWFYVSDTQFPYDGTPVTVQVGSSAKDVYMVYSVIAGNIVIESGALQHSNELENRKLTYRDEYGSGILLTFAWVKDGKVYTHSADIKRPVPEKQLKLQWNTFRNRLIPGQQEEWTLSITTPDGKPADAQFMATLYDKSLDQLAQHDWSLVPYCWLSTPFTSWRYGLWGEVRCSAHKPSASLSVRELAFNHFDHDIYPFSWSYHRRRPAMLYGAMRLTKGLGQEEALAMPAEPTMDMVVQKSAANDAADNVSSEADEESEAGKESSEASVKVRENLNETAFFYPQLVSDSLGHVSLKFTLPESLTIWRFLGVAHTRDMMYGSISDEAIARKDVMIQPNMPRFVRQGDQATISSRIFNTAEKTIGGTALIQVLDPENERVLYEQKQTVSLEPQSTTAVAFQVNAAQPQLAQKSLLIVRINISGPGYSDGEQHYLPVLPSKEYVTVTLPFTQNEPGTKAIDLQQLVPADASQTRLTVEYTNNPVWLMVLALPSIGHPNDDCALCQAASYYANTLGQRIIDQNPQVKNVFRIWQNEPNGEQPNTLNSQLEKNQELKELVLNETPWVVDADNEHEQRQRLADFFDENLMQMRLASALDKMQKLQLSDGSWSWWPEMKGSWYMTVEISEMLVRLNSQCRNDNASHTEMLDAAFKFMGKEVVEMVNEMKKMEKKGIPQFFPSHKALQWLYICTIDGRSQPKDVQEANDYLKRLLRKETKNQSIYDKALSAIVLNNSTYVRSLKEYTVYREDMGRYYDTPKALYSWRDYRIPTQVVAIEAIQRLTPADTLTVREMQRWLLQQKRTQAWNTPINSTDAVYAFLNGRPQTLSQQEKTVLTIDGQVIDTTNASAGLGYVKTAVPADGKQFKAEKTSLGTSWGAVYAQFLQPAANVTDQQSGLKVKREVYVSTPDGLAPLPAEQTHRFKVGDKVTVRITIEADRDYDFVQVVDKRAACMEPVNQRSGYVWGRGSFGGGFYCAPRDCQTCFYYDMMAKGKHIIEMQYYIDRVGTYETGTCTVGCAYAPEYHAITGATTLIVEP